MNYFCFKFFRVHIPKIVIIKELRNIVNNLTCLSASLPTVMINSSKHFELHIVIMVFDSEQKFDYHVTTAANVSQHYTTPTINVDSPRLLMEFEREYIQPFMINATNGDIIRQICMFSISSLTS